MSNNQRRQLLHFNKAQGYVILLAAVLIALEVWALLKNAINLLTILGLGSALLLLAIPFVTVILTARTTVRELKSTSTTLPLTHYFGLSLRRSSALLTFAATVLIPLVVLYFFFLQMYLEVIFGSIVSCSEMPCNVPIHLTMPDTLILQTLLGLALAIGLWGLNLLACMVATGLIKRGFNIAESAVVTSFVLLPTIVVVYQLYVFGNNNQVYLDVVAALLPYGLTCLGTLLLWRSPAQQALSTSRE